MKTKPSILIVAMSATIAISVALAKPDLNASMTLRDSSVIKGTVAHDAVLEGTVVFADNVKIPLPLIREFLADGTNDAKIVTLTNGDVFRVTPKTRELSLASVLGDLAIPISNIRKAAFSAPDSSSASLIFHCTFDSPEAVLKPAVGPVGTVILPGVFEAGKIDNAMRVYPRSESARFTIPAGFLKNRGTIEWWGKIESTSDGFSSCDPRFFRIRFTETIDSVFEFSSNDGAGGGGLVIRFPGVFYLQKRGQRNAWRYSQYFGEEKAQEWHHYTMVWNANGLHFPNEESLYQLAVFIDGKRIHVEPFDWRQKINAGILETQPATIDFPFNSDHDNPLIGNASYLIDELKIWDTDAPPSRPFAPGCEGD